jgi:hypothetical protein
MSGGPDATRRGEGASGDAARRTNPMNRLVPYLDLFARLGDEELARLAAVEADVVATLRRQVNEIGDGLAGYLDLLPRLGDEELVRLTGASLKTIRFWRRCQGRTAPAAASGAESSSVIRMPPEGVAARVPDPDRQRRTGGVAMQPTVLSTQTAEPLVADWSSEAPSTNARTTITPTHLPPRAAWDATSPASASATMITPAGQTPDATWDPDAPPSMTNTQAGPRPSSERTGASIDPAESQQSAAQLMNFDGEPFPGYEEWRPAPTTPVEDDTDFTVEIDR